MPLYEYQCKTCGKKAEKYNRIADHKKGPDCCGVMMKQILSKAHVHGDFEPYVDENLTDHPVVVKSKQHRKELMRKYNVTENIGKGWI